MAQHDSLEFFRRSRPEPKADQLEDTLEHDVAKGNHGTSSNTPEKGRYFTQTGLKTPYRLKENRGGGACERTEVIDHVRLVLEPEDGRQRRPLGHIR